MADQGGKHTARFERDSEQISQFAATAILKEFDRLVGGPLLCSPVVYLAALRVSRILLGPSDDPIAALDEIHALEAIPVAAAGGEAEANSSQ